MESDAGIARGSTSFPTTIPSLLAQSGSVDAEVRTQAWSVLAQTYWKPIYKYLRIRHHKTSEDAKDLTQSFFLLAIEGETFEKFDPEKAKFRTFLRCCVDRFVFNDYKQASRLKRGGGAEHLAAEFLKAEEEIALESVRDPETLFETGWIRSVFERALQSLAEIFDRRGKAESYRMFETYYLSEKDDSSYAALARNFNLSTADVTNRLASVRREFRRILLACLKETSISQEEYRRDARKLLGTELPRGEC
jgi:RNA polymerase sigma factor (sigma-70 family)